MKVPSKDPCVHSRYTYGSCNAPDSAEPLAIPTCACRNRLMFMCNSLGPPSKSWKHGMPEEDQISWRTGCLAQASEVEALGGWEETLSRS